MATAGSDRGARRVSYYTAPEALAHGPAPPVAKKQSLIGGAETDRPRRLASDPGQNNLAGGKVAGLSEIGNTVGREGHGQSAQRVA
jgi:hypothetical protein